MKKAYHGNKFRGRNKFNERFITNEQIRGDNLRVIKGKENLGLINRQEALNIARDANLDLILIATPEGQAPICKIMELSKYKYEKQQKAQKSRAKTKQQELKEFRVGVNTGENDIVIRINRARKFLEKKDKVRFNLRFRGREITHKELGYDRLNRVIEELSEVGVVEKAPELRGNQMQVTIAPK